MEIKYREIYDTLSKIKKLSMNRYDGLVSRYGSSLVNEVIDDMLFEDDKNVTKFEEYLADGLYCDSKEMDSFGYYLKDLLSFSVLDSDEVKTLAREISKITKRINEIFVELSDGNVFDKRNTNGFSGKYITSIIDRVDYCLFVCHDKELSCELEELCRELILRRDRIVLGNLRFVIYVARPYNRGDISFNELVQVGNLGLMRAAELYDPDKYDVLFTTYAYYWVKQSIMRAIKNLIFSVDISHKTVDRKYDKEDIYNILSQELGREPTNEEIARYMNLSVDDIRMLETTYSRPYSIDNQIYEDGRKDDYFGELLFINGVKDENVMIEDDYIFRETLREIRDILYSGELNKVQYDVLAYRYGFVDGNKHTLQEIADYYGITKEAVRQREERGLIKIRKIWDSRVFGGYLD